MNRWIAVSAIVLGSSLAAQFVCGKQEQSNTGSLRFAILGDRTGEEVAGVYQKVWREIDRDRPEFVISVGDTIQGTNDAIVDEQWQEVQKILLAYRRYEMFFVPGNHDVWSFASALEFEKYTHHPLHYGFDYKNVHFTVLNNSRSDNLQPSEYTFLQKDLEANEKRPVKFIFMHRPSWLIYAALGDPKFALHQLAKRYGVQYVIAGHLHRMMRFELEGVTYLSLPSSGGHLRGEKDYRNGSFFGHALATVIGSMIQIEIKEADEPFGESRISKPEDWGAGGLISGPRLK